MHGNARVKKYIQIGAAASKAPGLVPAEFVAHGLDGAWAFDDNKDEEISFNFAFPSDVDRTEIIELRIGWSQVSSSGDVEWEVEYNHIGLGEDTSSITPEGTVTQTQTVSNATNGYAITSFNLTIPDSTARITEIKLTRLGTSINDTASGDAHFLGAVLEYTSNVLGRQL